MASIFDTPGPLFLILQEFFYLYDFLNSLQRLCCAYGFEGWGVLPGRDNDIPYNGSKLIMYLCLITYIQSSSSVLSSDPLMHNLK